MPVDALRLLAFGRVVCAKMWHHFFLKRLTSHPDLCFSRLLEQTDPYEHCFHQGQSPSHWLCVKVQARTPAGTKTPTLHGPEEELLWEGGREVWNHLTWQRALKMNLVYALRCHYDHLNLFSHVKGLC